MNAAKKAASVDFAKLVEMFDEHGVPFVSVTQSFNTTTSTGRLTLNVLLSFAQFERNFSLWSSIGAAFAMREARATARLASARLAVWPWRPD